MEVSLYNSKGKAEAYISTNEENAIYLWNGRAVAYILEDAVFSWRGKHIGWYSSEKFYNLHGKIVGSTAAKCRCVTQVERVKSVKSVKSVKGIRSVKNVKSVFSLSYSNQSLEEYLLSFR